jgi:hypothetical protein
LEIRNYALRIFRFGSRFYRHGQLEHSFVESFESREELEMHGTFVADALQNLDIKYEGYDYTDEFRDWWPRIKEHALALRPEYEREGNAFIADVYIKEADTEFLPAIEAGDIRKYMYIATV